MVVKLILPLREHDFAKFIFVVVVYCVCEIHSFLVLLFPTQNVDIGGCKNCYLFSCGGMWGVRERFLLWLNNSPVWI